MGELRGSSPPKNRMGSALTITPRLTPRIGLAPDPPRAVDFGYSYYRPPIAKGRQI